MRSMENNMIKSTTIWGIFNPRSYYVAQARFSQDILAQSCFYFNGVDICFEKNNVLWKCQHARRSMIQCMDAMTYALWNYAHGVLHWLWCAGHDAWLMVHVLECMLATVGVMQVLLIIFILTRIRTQVIPLCRLRKIVCRRVAIADYDTNAHLVTQAYGCSAYEALGSVAAPYVSDKHHGKMKI